MVKKTPVILETKEYKNRLVELRKSKNWSRKDVCNATGIKYETLKSYELHKTHIPADRLNILADVYGVSTDYLLGRESKIKSSDPAVKVCCEYLGLSEEAVEMLHNKCNNKEYGFVKSAFPDIVGGTDKFLQEFVESLNNIPMYSTIFEWLILHESFVETVLEYMQNYETQDEKERNLEKLELERDDNPSKEQLQAILEERELGECFPDERRLISWELSTKIPSMLEEIYQMYKKRFIKVPD